MKKIVALTLPLALAVLAGPLASSARAADGGQAAVQESSAQVMDERTRAKYAADIKALVDELIKSRAGDPHVKPADKRTWIENDKHLQALRHGRTHEEMARAPEKEKAIYNAAVQDSLEQREFVGERAKHIQEARDRLTREFKEEMAKMRAMYEQNKKAIEDSFTASGKIGAYIHSLKRSIAAHSVLADLPNDIELVGPGVAAAKVDLALTLRKWLRARPVLYSEVAAVERKLKAGQRLSDQEAQDLLSLSATTEAVLQQLWEQNLTWFRLDDEGYKDLMEQYISTHGTDGNPLPYEEEGFSRTELCLVTRPFRKMIYDDVSKLKSRIDEVMELAARRMEGETARLKSQL